MLNCEIHAQHQILLPGPAQSMVLRDAAGLENNWAKHTYLYSELFVQFDRHVPALNSADNSEVDKHMT